jgi:hypothetical protein
LVFFLLPLALASCVHVPETNPEDVSLPPLFSNNMVLQQGTPVVIWGWGPPGRKVWVRFQHLKATSKKVARNCRWAVELDLADLKIPTYPGELQIGVGKPGQNLRKTFTNVAVGNVWLLGVCDGKGLPLKAREGLSWDPEHIRFLTLTNLASLHEASRPSSTSWQPCATNDLDLRQISAFSFYMAFNLGDGYVGVIQTSTNSLVGGLADPVPTTAALPRERDEQVRLGLPAAWGIASNLVHQAQEARKAVLDEGKIRRVVINLPEIFQCDFPTIYPRAAFSTAQPPANMVSFEGAIW